VIPPAGVDAVLDRVHAGHQFGRSEVAVDLAVHEQLAEQVDATAAATVRR
jgi:hypothetical protein